MTSNSEPVSPGHIKGSSGTLNPRQKTNLTSILFKAVLLVEGPGNA